MTIKMPLLIHLSQLEINNVEVYKRGEKLFHKMTNFNINFILLCFQYVRILTGKGFLSFRHTKNGQGPML
jgi:hypothetical protein